MIVFFALSLPAFAKPKQQPAQTQEHQLTADDIINKWKIALDLSDKQMEQLKPIVEDYLAKQEALKLEEKKKLRKVLSGDQMYAWEDLQKQSTKGKKKHSL